MKKGMKQLRNRIASAALAAVLLLVPAFAFASCSGGGSGSESPEDASLTSGPEDFEDYPACASPLVKVHAGDGSLLFEYITPGMDASDSYVVLYSLKEKRTVRRFDLGRGLFSVQTMPGGGFSVFEPSGNGGVLSFYSADGSPAGQRRVDCMEGEAGSLLVSGKTGRMLATELSTGLCCLISSDGTEKTVLDLSPGPASLVGTEGDRFVLTHGEKGTVVVEDGKVRTLFSKGSADFLNQDYAAGRAGDHFCFFPLDEGSWLFVPAFGPEEFLSAAGKAGFLTMERTEGNTVLRLYRPSSLSALETTVREHVAAAAVTDDGRIALVCGEPESGPYVCRMLTTDGWTKRALLAENDLSAVFGAVSLPGIGSRDAADAFAAEILEKYNVRFVYEPCELFDALVEAGLASELSDDREEILRAEHAVADTFRFFPDAVWKGIGDRLPYVVFLCGRIPGNTAGWNYEWGGYNCTFMEIGGVEPYMKSLFMHETGHAISRCVSRVPSGPDLLEKWVAATPEDVMKAVEKGTVDGKNAITVEFTPYDRDGNVCFVSDYAMKNPEEDRAETLAAVFTERDGGGDGNLFSHPVLYRKALLWEEMIRTAFGIGESVSLPFDDLAPAA